MSNLSKALRKLQSKKAAEFHGGVRRAIKFGKRLAKRKTQVKR